MPPNGIPTTTGEYESRRGLQWIEVGIAEARKAKGAVPVFHSCDPMNTKMLTHYKRGSFMPHTGYEQDYPTEKVLVPRRYGKTEKVLRCAKGPGGCMECENTGTDVGVYKLRPEPFADGRNRHL